MAFVELARETGENRYLDMARYFVDVRGYGLVKGDEYHQDQKPFRDFDEMVGHAVRILYLNAGAADLYAENGQTSIFAALDRLWLNMTTKRMYLTGGRGARHDGESFGVDYELPNFRLYTETCAAIASMMWNWRMLILTGDSLGSARGNGVVQSVVPQCQPDSRCPNAFAHNQLYGDPVPRVGELGGGIDVGVDAARVSESRPENKVGTGEHLSRLSRRMTSSGLKHYVSTRVAHHARA